MGIFLSLDLICFFIFWEAMLVPMYFLIAGWGSERRVYAAMKFFIYTAAGSAFLLASILVLGFLHQNDDRGPHVRLPGPRGLERARVEHRQVLFLGFMIAFAIKAPLFPFHTWLPDVHTEAPTAGSVVLAGVILKMGAYGFLRFSFELFPDASVYFAPLIMTLAVIGIVYGSIVAAMQTDIKRVIAFSSVAHMGFILLGIFSLTIFGLDGAAFNMLSHPLTTGSALPRRRHALRAAAHPPDLGVRRHLEVRAGAHRVLPHRDVRRHRAARLLRVHRRVPRAGRRVPDPPLVGRSSQPPASSWPRSTCSGRSSGCSPACPKARTRSCVTSRSARSSVVAPLLAISLFIGIYPKPVIDRVEPTVERVIANFREEDRLQAAGAGSGPQPRRAPRRTRAETQP